MLDGSGKGVTEGGSQLLELPFTPILFLEILNISRLRRRGPKKGVSRFLELPKDFLDHYEVKR